MSPQEARLLLVQDVQGVAQTDAAALELLGNHVVVYCANSLEHAKEFINDGGLEREGIQVAVLDRNLGHDDKDGERVAAMMQEEHPGIGIIGFTSNDTFVGCDYFVQRCEGLGSLEKLSTAITEMEFPYKR